MEYVKCNCYKIDLSGDYEVSATFNVSNLSPFNVGKDLRMNPSEEGGDNKSIVSKVVPMKVEDTPTYPKETEGAYKQIGLIESKYN